ncbi:hypothetical protein [Actinoallomurus sp. CA-150999]|uniref:hypothetical protein n=1 Tax=Actinoallomurus sp. CA-150999 TaxID=3239887 RepID=UPI003D8D7530
MDNPDPEPTPIGKLPQAVAPTARPTLPLTWGNFITGDFAGIQALASQLYKFADGCNTEVSALARCVDSLIAADHERWHGETATLFKASFGQDAVMMNGTNRAIVSIAGVLDRLAERLAKTEYLVEQQVDKGVNAGYVQVEPDGKATEIATVPGTPTSVYLQLQALIDKARINAQRARSKAASELVALGAALMSGLNYYSGESGKPGSLDPNGLLTADQQKSDAVAIARLKAELKKEAGELGTSGKSLKSALSDVSKVGGDAQKISTIIGDLKGAKNLPGIMSTVGPVIEDIGGEIGIAALAG